MHQFLHVAEGRIAGVVRHGGVVPVGHVVRDLAECHTGQRRKRKQRNRQPARRRARQINFHSHPKQGNYRIADFEI
jgi:hypothetical protein